MFTILSLDGGGVRGYLSAQILAKLETHLNRIDGRDRGIGERFDLIAGTSTGGILALGLAYGKSAGEIAQFYETHSANVFAKATQASRIAQWFRPKYPPYLLQNALRAVFPDDATMRDLKTDVCITAVSLQNAKPRLYKTDYFTRNTGRTTERLIDVAMATAAAPTFFPAHSSVHSTHLVDGGICANNPTIIAVVDALQFERRSKRETPQPAALHEVAVLSVGTGASCAVPYNYKALASAGKAAWGFAYFRVAIEAQSELVHFQAKFLLPNYLRINPTLTFVMDLDDYEQLAALKNLSDMTDELAQFGERFLRT